ncbi:MAG: cell division protein ZapA [Candidatus Rokubacteria bacterium]|nr:cell division protein ZapA [Candidatus Rokubacteria bacterium]MBI3824912.1 cell division protein ZapA [Candidatus Rokubacteria bacterium]
MTDTQRIELTVLGQKLTIRSAESREYLQSLVRHLEGRVAALRSSGVKDPQTALVLAALEIVDDLFRARAADGDLGQRLDALLTLLDRATPR